MKMWTGRAGAVITPTMDMPYSLIDPRLPPVSRLSLGSWNTFSRCTAAELERLLGMALDNGINLFDVGYYWDKPDTEAAVAAALRSLARPRDSFLIAQKLWLWNYPAQSFRQQLEGSLDRLGLDQVDMVLVSRPTPDLDLATYLAEVVALVEQGLARSWGVTNYPAALVRETVALARASGWPQPAMLQLQYNVMRRGIVEGSDYAGLFADGTIKLCAAHMLEGGILGGHLERDRVDPPEFAAGVRPPERNIARDSGGIREEICARQPRLAQIAADFGATPAQLALAFCLSHPHLATALVGVSRCEDLAENLGALDLLGRADAVRQAVAPLAIAGVGHPKLFNPHNDI